jgi:hypothetical protein
MFCGPLRGIKVERKGFWGPSGVWVNTSAKVIMPKGAVTFNKGANPYLRDRLKAKQKLEKSYQDTLAKIYSENFPDY